MAIADIVKYRFGIHIGSNTMRLLPKVKVAVTALSAHMDRVRLSRGFVIDMDTHTLPPAARRHLGLID